MSSADACARHRLDWGRPIPVRSSARPRVGAGTNERDETHAHGALDVYLVVGLDSVVLLAAEGVAEIRGQFGE